MKRKDFTLIAAAIFVSALASFFISKVLFNSPKNRQQPVEVVNPITADFNKPDSKYFNKDAVNPTKLIQIGENQNTTPFNTKQ